MAIEDCTCGKRARIHMIDNPLDPKIPNIYAVQCTDHDCPGGPRRANPIEAIEAWNKRMIAAKTVNTDGLARALFSGLFGGGKK